MGYPSVYEEEEEIELSELLCWSEQTKWKLGISERGLGRQTCAVLDRFKDFVVELANRADAELIHIHG